MNNRFPPPGFPRRPCMHRHQMPGMQRPQMPGMQRHQMPGMQRPQMGQGGTQQMSSMEALQLSGLGTGDLASKAEWLVVMIRAERQGLVERISPGMYLIGPEFWQALSEEFGRPVGPGGGDGDQDPFGQDGFDDGQGGFPSPGPRPRPY